MPIVPLEVPKLSPRDELRSEIIQIIDEAMSGPDEIGIVELADTILEAAEERGLEFPKATRFHHTPVEFVEMTPEDEADIRGSA